MKTLLPPQKQSTERTWYVIDATGQTLGRLAARIAPYLTGKLSPSFTPHLDNGDYVVVLNADKIVTTGNKDEQKMYRSHSGFMGGLKEMSLAQARRVKPTFPLESAVMGMLPKNNLRANQISRLRIFTGSEHPYSAQQPVSLSN